MDQNIYANILASDKTQRNYKIFKSYRKVCKSSSLCRKIVTRIKNFNKLAMFQYNF